MKYLGKGKSQSMVLYNHASVIQDVKKRLIECFISTMPNKGPVHDVLFYRRVLQVYTSACFNPDTDYCKPLYTNIIH